MTDYKQICRDLIAAIDVEAREHTLGFELLKAYADANTALAAPMDDLRQASADVSGVEVLSPAAQAVLDAFRTSHTGQGCLAAALRAVAEQVGPSEILPPGYAYSAPAEMWHYEFKLKAQRQILAIADELEGKSDD